jgi:hypothetical protein
LRAVLLRLSCSKRNAQGMRAHDANTSVCSLVKKLGGWHYASTNHCCRPFLVDIAESPSTKLRSDGLAESLAGTRLILSFLVFLFADLFTRRSSPGIVLGSTDRTHEFLLCEFCRQHQVAYIYPVLKSSANPCAALCSLQQVLSNLLSNAIKFTKSGGIVIRWKRLPCNPSESGRLSPEVRTTYH